MNQRIVIDRLELDLRGVDPAIAREAVHLLGPALRTALAAGPPTATGAAPTTIATLDAGRVAPVGGPQQLAARLAARLATRIADGMQEG